MGARFRSRVLTTVGLVITLRATEAPGQAPGGRFESAWAPLQQYWREAVVEEGIVGASLAFFHGDTVLAKEFHGFADLASRRKVDERTIYHWASITKTFTGIGLMQLRDRGRLTLDDPIVKYLPELRAIHDPFGDPGVITLKHLLSHSAGFRNPTWPWGGDQPWHPFEPTAWSQLVAMMPYTEILFPPGSKYSYSNPGIIFIGKTIEQLSGDDYEVYIDKNILRPLDMRATYFDRTPYHLLRDRSNNYDIVEGQPLPNGLDFDTGITVSNGGLNAPITDLLKYLQFLVGAPGLSADAKAVLSRASLEEMWRPVIATADSGSVGLIFFLTSQNGVRLVGHTGSQQAFRSFFFVQPESKTGIIGVFNTAPRDDPRNPTGASGAKPDIAKLFAGIRSRMGPVFQLYRVP
jgi:CubicO group peptidase (beta-lactamase class C family)